MFKIEPKFCYYVCDIVGIYLKFFLCGKSENSTNPNMMLSRILSFIIFQTCHFIEDMNAPGKLVEKRKKFCRERKKIKKNKDD